MYLGDAQFPKKTFYWQHLLAWVSGMLCALVPFLGDWEIGAMKIPVRFGPGNFGFNILIVTGLCTAGGIIGGYWWRFCKWLMGKRDLLLTVLTFVLPALGVSGLIFPQIHSLFFYLFAALIVVGVIIAFLCKDKTVREWPNVYDVLVWFRERSRLNAIFFIIFFLVLAASNTLSLLGLDVTLAEKISAIIGRLLVCGVFAGVLYLLSELTMRAAPRYFKWVPWVVFSMAPLIVIADQWIGIALNRRFLEFVNSLTSSGEFEPLVELSASGLDMGPFGALMLIFGVLASALVLAWVAWTLSKRWDMKISVGTALLMSLLCWCGVVAEQGLGSQWKSVSAWQAEHKLFNVNIGLFSPPKGVGRYAVTFHDPKLGLEKTASSIVSNKPDIYIFMVESMRGDAVSQKTTPFLWKIKEEECQELGTTWATSNSTHLSWFGLFYSQIPIYWRSTLEGVTDRSNFMGAPALQWIKKSGYDIEVRAVCDLGYKDFGLLNFGGGLSLVEVWQDTERGIDFGNIGIPEREITTFETLRESVTKRDEGGGFFFTALDSPHYNYYWHDSFEPPHDNYEEYIRSFPFNPSEKTVGRFKRRYLNSIAWVDYQVKEFCDFLKKEGRYDNALIIVTGDHGEEFQEQGSWCHCSSLQPEQIQVPLLIKWPKSMGRGAAFSEASHLDVMPSVLHMLGFPSNETNFMAGKNLLGQVGAHTQIATTPYAGQSGETMILRRGGYQATFSWSSPWDSRVPDDMVLERLEGPEGNIFLASPQAYERALRDFFPDAFERFFDSFEVIED